MALCFSRSCRCMFHNVGVTLTKNRDLNLFVISKRLISSESSNKYTDDQDNKSTIEALNVSNSILIDKISQLRNLENYRVAKLPTDLMKEAILLTPSNPPTDSDKLGDIFIFRKGTVVSWGVSNESQNKLLKDLSPLIIDPHSYELVQAEREYLRFSINQSSDRSRLDRDIIKLGSYADYSLRHIDQFAISHAMTSSVRLAVWELNLDEYLNSINWITDRMKNGDDLKLTRSQVFRKTGEIYQLKHEIISSDLLDLPDVYWDRYYQEVLYLSIVSFLNIKKRTAVMNEKLNNCCELMNLLATHMSDKHHVRLEWMIIILILIEVIFEIVR